jgi:hypothetical protein
VQELKKIAQVSFVLCFWIALQSSSSLGQDANLAQEEDLREAIVRYQIANWDLNAKVYFISIKDKDPAKQFLERFADVKYPVKGKSASKQDKSPMNWVVEKKTKKIGVVFDQGLLRWSSDTQVSAEGGYYCGSLCSAGGTYHVERREGRWLVTGFEVTFMS